MREKPTPTLKPDGQTGFDFATSQNEPAFLDDDGPSAEIPPFITTANARELYGLRPGETVSQAMARCSAKGR